jgi:hypothetical protein
MLEIQLKVHLKVDTTFHEIDTRNRFFPYYLYSKRVGKLRKVKDQYDQTATSTTPTTIYRANSLTELKTPHVLGQWEMA